MSKVKIINNKSIDSLGTIKRINYSGCIKKTYLLNEKNRSNFYTIIKEVCGENSDDYFISSKLEIGEKYVTYFKYDQNGEIIYERRYNKSKKKFNTQELFHENENGKILLNNYNNQKTISFTSKKLKNGKQK